MAKKNREPKISPSAFPGVVLQRRPAFDQTIGYIIPPPEVALGYYRRIAQSDATVAACLEFVTMTAISRLGEYQHPRGDIRDFIRANFELLEGSFVDTCRDMLSCLWAGFSVTEIVTKVYGNRIWLHSLPVLPCETVTFHLNEDVESIDYGSINYVIQRPYQMNEAILPVGKCIILRNYYSGCLAQSPYGMSRLQVVLHAWEQKEQIEEDWTKTLTRYAMPLLKYKLEEPERLVHDDVTGEDMPAYQLARKQAEQWKNGDGFIYGGGNDLEMIFPPNNIGKSFEDSVAYWNRIIMRGLLIPSLLFENGDSGSYALGQEHFELFQLSMDALLSNLTEAILEQLVRPLITWNFGPQETWGSFEIKENRNEVQTWAYLLQAITSTGVVDMNNLEDVNAMRRKLGFDPLDSMPVSKPSQDMDALLPFTEGTKEI